LCSRDFYSPLSGRGECEAQCVLGAETEFYANILIKFTFEVQLFYPKVLPSEKAESQSRQRRCRRVADALGTHSQKDATHF